MGGHQCQCKSTQCLFAAARRPAQTSKTAQPSVREQQALEYCSVNTQEILDSLSVSEGASYSKARPEIRYEIPAVSATDNDEYLN